MTVKVDGSINEELRNKHSFIRFLKDNTHGGVVTPHVEVFKTVTVEKKNNEEEFFHWIMSTMDLDRDKEKVDVKGWLLETYLKNPVVLWSHDWSLPAIGYAKNVKADDVLSGDLIFNSKEIDSFGWSIGQRVKEGSLRSGSVGFRVEEVEFIDHKSNVDEEADLIYRKQELLEFSICNVPANPFAQYMGTDAKGYRESRRDDSSSLYTISNFLKRNNQ